MEVTTFHDARQFRTAADPLLLRNEPANNLILGVTGHLLDNPQAYDEFIGWVVADSRRPLAAAARTPPYNLILADSESAEAIRALATSLGELPGVVGCLPGVETFVGARHGDHIRQMRQGVFQLDEVVAPPEVAGISRPAVDEDLDPLLDMLIAFQEEASPDPVTEPDRLRRNLQGRINEQSNLHGMWVHFVEGRVVSMSGHSGPTPNGIRIGPVFTPVSERGKGYASNLVATQSQWLLDSGHAFCFLYTDLANTTSNAIYRRIGYRQIAESAQYSFNPST